MRFSKLDARIQAVILAYATTGLSKIATVGVQIVALPIVAKSVGLHQFGAMLTLAGVASLLSIVAQGLGPATSYSLAKAHGAKDADAHRKSFWASMILALSGASGATLLGLLTFAFLPESILTSKDTAGFVPELRLTLLSATAHVALLYTGGFVDGARAAAAQNHITNFFSFIASCLVFVVCLLAGHLGASLPLFYLIIFGIPALAQCVNLLAFMIEHRQLLGAPIIQIEPMKRTWRRTTGYIIAQSGFVLHLHGVVIFSGTVLGLQAGAVAGALTRAFILLQSALVSLANPVLPLVTKADAANEPGEARRILTGMMLGSIACALIIGLVFALAGDDVLRLWLGIKVAGLSPTTFAAGLLFFGYSTTHIGYLTLLAADSVGTLATKYCLGGVAAMAIDYLLFSGGTVAGPLMVSAFAILVVNGIALELQLRRTRSALGTRAGSANAGSTPA